MAIKITESVLVKGSVRWLAVLINESVIAVLKGTTLVKTADDAIGITEGIVRLERSIRLMADTVGITEAIVQLQSSIRLISDAIGITDAAIRRFISVRLVADIEGITDDIVRRLRSVHLVEDIVNIADSILEILHVVTTAIVKFANDTVIITDSVIRRAWMILLAVNTIAITEAITLRKRIAMLIEDAVSITEDVVKTTIAVIIKAISDTVGITDSIIRRMWMVRLISNIVGIVDRVIKRAWAVYVVNNTLSILDSVLRRAKRTYTTLDIVAISDNVIAYRFIAVILIKVINESIGILETIIKAFRGVFIPKGPLGYEILSMRKATETQPYQRVDCPTCMWPLETALDGTRHCKLCGYQDTRKSKGRKPTSGFGVEIYAMREATETSPYQRQDCVICGNNTETTAEGITHCKHCGWSSQKRVPILSDMEIM